MTRGAALRTHADGILAEIVGSLLPVNPMGILVTYIQDDQVVDF